MPSLNHFFTTKTTEDRTQEPYCPPGWDYNEDLSTQFIILNEQPNLDFKLND